MKLYLIQFTICTFSCYIRNFVKSDFVITNFPCIIKYLGNIRKMFVYTFFFLLFNEKKCIVTSDLDVLGSAVA